MAYSLIKRNNSFFFLGPYSYPVNSESLYGLSVAYLANILYGMHMGISTSCLSSFLAGLCLNMMAYMDDLGKQFTDLDMRYERIGASKNPVSRQLRERYLNIEITKCIKAHYKIQQ